MIGAALFCAIVVGSEVDFERDVAPIFEARCLSCHDDVKRKGGLSLVRRVDALSGGDSGDPAIVPGDPDGSGLIAAVSAEAGEVPSMPRKQTPLENTEVAILREWIARGANWPDDRALHDRAAEYEFAERANWWSLKPLEHVTPPRGAEGAMAANSIDAFLDAFLDEAIEGRGLEVSPLADRRTLIRRVTFDLTGLPPAPEDVAAFVADERDDAYERWVDRLLASPRYGERFARAWLDLVHFGETHGYDKDKPRPNAWPYRDYVIRNLNADKPYDRFVLEQLAGDVIAPHDGDAIVATGFIAAGPWDFVGHVELREGTKDKAITRNLDRDDMVTTTMSTFASATVHCARCHDHKFDAIRQLDYYSLQAVFAGVERADREYDGDAGVARDRERLRRDLARIDAPSNAAPSNAAPSNDAHVRLGWHGELSARAEAECWVGVDLGSPTPIDEVIVVPAHEAYGGWPGPGFGFPLRFVVEVANAADFGDARVLADFTGRDFANPGDRPLITRGDGSPARYVRVRASKLWPRTGDFAFALGELIVANNGRNAAAKRPGIASSSIEAAPRWSLENLTDGRTRSGDLDDSAASFHPWRTRIESRANLEAALAALGAAHVVYAVTPVVGATGSGPPNAFPRPIHLLLRGDVSAPDPVHGAVAPGALSAVAAIPSRFEDSADEGARRLALAQWLVSPENPLTWRSIVNRVWGWHFGNGIVTTPNDFGHMGALPSHPRLLDWLARDFLDRGASLKALHRAIVTTKAYRRSSLATPRQLAEDGSNVWLARSPRRRLDAEQFHDSLLWLADRLDPTIGGPSIRRFAFHDDHSPIYDYSEFEPDLSSPQRRAIYRFVVRSVADPFFDGLDCPDASLLTPKRNETITALSALALQNDPFVFEACVRFAERLQRDRPDDRVAQVEFAFQLALSRPPTKDESEAFVAHASRHGLAAMCRVLVNLAEFSYID